MMDLVKKNLVAVIALALAIIGVPVLIYFSMQWNASVRETLKTETSRAMSTLNNTRLDLTVPGVGAGGGSWQAQVTPSESRIEGVVRARQRVKELSEGVRKEYVERNKRDFLAGEGEKELLVDGESDADRLFPEPPNASASVRLRTEMMRRYPEAHEAMLERYRVSGPPARERINAQLVALSESLRADALAGGTDTTLTEEQQAEIRRELGERRLGFYRDHAATVGLFGSMDAFTRVVELDPNVDEIIDLERAWEWQHVTWVHRDVLAALLEAGGDETNVIRSPVKRLLELTVDQQDVARGGSAGGFTGGRGGRAGRSTPEPNTGGGAEASGDLSQPIPPDYSVSLTGHAGWPTRPNPLYDVRMVQLQLVADGNRLGEIIDAINSTNLMTVVDLDFTEYDVSSDRQAGYFYSDSPRGLVLLTLDVETLWLREWTKEYMPPTVRERLGIPADPEAAEDDVAAAGG
jgi:hypothetical protein